MNQGNSHPPTSEYFKQIAAIIANIGDPETLTVGILALVQDYLQADRVVLYLGVGKDEIDLVGARGASGEALDLITRFCTKILNKHNGSGTADDLSDVPIDYSKDPGAIDLDAASVLVIPLVIQQRTLGMVYADRIRVPEGFIETDRVHVQGLALQISALLEQSRRVTEVLLRAEAPRKPGRGRLSFQGVVSDSRKMQKLLRLAIRASSTDQGVLLTGPMGTGKRVMADLIQQHSRRARMPYVPVDCSVFEAAQFEMAVLGADATVTGGGVAREGLIEQAHTGTLLLEGVCSLGAESQAMLWKALADPKFKRAGGTRQIDADVRIIATTRVDLLARVKSGTFNGDLYRFLNSNHIAVVPLSEHRDDIPGLAQMFLDRECEGLGLGQTIRMDPPVLDWLCGLPWPGNVHELSTAIGRMVALDSDGVLSWDDVPADVRAVWQLQSPKFNENSTFDNLMAIAEASILKRALENAGGKIRKASRVLVMPEATLRRRLKMLNLHKPTQIQMRRARRTPPTD
jgi:DNA-binding NtrC family response regulator